MNKEETFKMKWFIISIIIFSSIVALYTGYVIGLNHSIPLEQLCGPAEHPCAPWDFCNVNSNLSVDDYYCTCEDYWQAGGGHWKCPPNPYKEGGKQ